MVTTKKIYLFLLAGVFAVFSLYFSLSYLTKGQQPEPVLSELSALRSFAIDIHTVGELEAMRSTSVTSALKGDLGKIIFLVPDGLSVKAQDILVKMDPTPFEEHIEDLKRQIREQHSKVEILERLVSWETAQVEHEERSAQIEVETAGLEINKIVDSDGPMEEIHLKLAMQKSFAKLEEMKGYTDALMELQKQGFLNLVELKQANKKLAEEEEIYQSAKMQYESYIHHTQPVQIKKAKAALKRCKNKYEEAIKSGAFRVAKAQAQRDHALLEMVDLQAQLKNAEHQMSFTEIRAPSKGMVIHKEEFRNGQRRKPRIGDVLIKNQPILDLPDLENMLVKTKVREIDLFKIKEGTSTTVEIDAYPEMRFKGKIVSIGVLALSDLARTGEEKYFDVTVKLEASDTRLRPGMTARVILHANRVENKCSIPVQSVFEFNKQYYCFVKTEKGSVAVPIETGYSNEQWVEIRSELPEHLPILISMPPWSMVENAEDLLEERA